MARLQADDEEARSPDELEQLEPSPVDDYPTSPADEKSAEYFPPQARPIISRSTTGLGLSGHNAPWYCESSLLLPLRAYFTY
jgi:hypothetical protein